MNSAARRNCDGQTINQFALLLHAVPRIGDRTIARVLRAAITQGFTTEDFLTMGEEQWISDFSLDLKAVKYLKAHIDVLPAAVTEQARLLRNLDIELVTCQNATYPHRIESFDDDMPPVLYMRGAQPLLNQNQNAFTFTAAISRGHTRQALEWQEGIANGLIALGGVPVTGHDRPAYQRLALTAQRLGKPGIFILDRGLLEAMGPACTRPLFAAARIRDEVFACDRDLVISPFRLNDHCVGGNNVRRDKIVVALSQAVIAIDVSPDGGMLEHCRRAMAAGIPVFADKRGRDGCRILVDEGAIWLEDTDDAITAQIRARLGALS